MHVPNHVQIRVQAEVNRCMDIAKEHYSLRELHSPRVEYNVRGRVAGYAKLRQNVVDFNSVLLMENLDDFISETVPHEVAHIVDFQVYGIQRRGRKQIQHGDTWRWIMRMFGVSPDRCHQYDTTNSAVRRKARYDYKCSGCGDTLQVGPSVHRKIQAGQHRWHRGCGPSTHIYFDGVQQPQPIAARQNTPKRRSKSGSTLERVRAYMRENIYSLRVSPPGTRPLHIAHDLGIKTTTATTYYHKLKTEVGLL